MTYAEEAEADARLRADLGPRGFLTKPKFECEHGVYWATCDDCHPLPRYPRAAESWKTHERATGTPHGVLQPSPASIHEDSA